MKAELETRFINAYLSKEISNLEKEMALTCLGTMELEEDNVDELFKGMLERTKELYQKICEYSTTEERDIMVMNVKKLREDL